MIMKIRKMLLCFFAVQILFVSLAAISYAATCSNNWRVPSSQTMETEIMTGSMTDYANIERYLTVKQGWKTTHVYFLQGVLLVKGLDDDEINYDNIFWYPMMFMQSGVLSKAFPQGPCSITQKTPMALTEAEGEVVPTSQGVIEYDYTLKGKQNVKHFKGVMKFTPKEAAPSDDTVVKGFKIVSRTKPYTVIGSKDMPVTTLGELRRALDAKKTPKERERQAQVYQELNDLFAGKDTTKDTMKPEDIIMAPEVKTRTEDSNELYPLKIGNLFGYVNKAGSIVIEPKYNLAFFFDGRLAKVHIKYKWGVIDKTGRFVIAPQYEEIGRFRDGLACVRKNGKIGFINESGTVIVPIEGDDKYLPAYEKGVAAFTIKDKSYYVDKNGKFITKEQFWEAREYNNSKFLRPMQKDGKWGLINAKNELILKPTYDHIDYEKDGLFVVKKNERYGFIDRTGNLVIDLQFEYAYDFKDGFAGVKKNGKYGFIDKTGHIVVEPQFDSVREFEDGIAVVMIDKKCGLIDSTGRYIVKPQFEDISFHHGVGKIQKNDKWGIVDKAGKILIEPQYIMMIEYPNSAHPYAPNVFAVTKIQHKGYADTLGNVFVMTDKVCGRYVVKNSKGEITWPRNIKELCGQKN